MKKISLVNRILNVADHEWPRIALSWTLQFISRIGFIVGWTVTVAMFISRMGIEKLPLLFVANAVLIIGGSIIYSYLIPKIKRPLLISYTALLGGLLLIVASLFSFNNDWAFFGLIVLSQAVLLYQLNILIALFTEDLFSPLESQRAFPLITTAETIGGILGGLMVGVLSSYIPSYKFIYLWVLIIFLIVPTIMTSKVYSEGLPILKTHRKERRLRNKMSHTRLFKKLKIVIRKIKKTPFLQGLVLVVLLQYMLFNIMEFQYTKAIQEEVMTHSDHGLGIENELTKDLGILLMVFSSGSFLVQLLLASRILTSLGVIGTLLLHPFMTLLNLAGMSYNFNFLSATIGRSNFEITGKLFHTAYHSSYYAISETIRDHVKEFMDGIVKPFGAILGFGLIYLAQYVTSGAEETLMLNMFMIAITLGMGIRLIFLQENYTDITYQNLETSGELHTRLDAIEILSQKGHAFETEKLIKYLVNKKEKDIVRLKILEALKGYQDPETIPEILECLESENTEVRLAAIETLQKFTILEKENRNNHLFSHFHINKTIKILFKKDHSPEIRSAIIELLAKIDQENLIEFLTETMQSSDEKTIRACIHACRQFNDISLIPYLKDFLDHKNPNIRAETITSLWQFPKLQKTLRHYLEQMMKNKKPESILATLYALGEIKDKKALRYLMTHLGSNNKEIRHEAAQALAKINHKASVPHLAEAISTYEYKWAKKTQKFIKSINKNLADDIDQLVQIKVSAHICELLNANPHQTLNDLDLDSLEKLKTAYSIVDEHKEISKIEQIIKAKQKKAIKKHSYAMAT